MLRPCLQLSVYLLILVVVHDHEAVLRGTRDQIVALADHTRHSLFVVQLRFTDYYLGFHIIVFDHTVSKTERDDRSTIWRAVNPSDSSDLRIVLV